MSTSRGGLSGVCTVWNTRDLSSGTQRPWVSANTQNNNITAAEIVRLHYLYSNSTDTVETCRKTSTKKDTGDLRDPWLALHFSRDLLRAWRAYEKTIRRAKDKRRKVLELVQSDDWKQKCKNIHKRYGAEHLPTHFILNIYKPTKIK